MLRIYAGKYGEIVEDMFLSASRELGFEADDVDVEMSVVSEEEIKKSNAETRSIDEITDVLSFQNIEDAALPLDKRKYPAEINPEDGSLILGEVLVCGKRAEEQAKESGRSAEEEVAFLFCHGLLHLLGYNHDSDEEAAKMNELCEKIISPRPKDDFPSEVPFKSGFVAVLGRPNAGKSTLVNTIVGERVAIVSRKPQTTRNKISGVYNEKDCQIIFLDTPGLQEPRNALGEYMVKSAASALDGADCVVYLIDAERNYSGRDKANVARYLDSGLKVIAAVNKIDRVTREKVFLILRELNEEKRLSAVVPISGLRNKNVDALLSEVKKLLTDTVRYYDEDQYTDKSLRFTVGEIVREKALKFLDKEIPYGIGVEIREYSVRPSGVTVINADIICEKKSHKPIILGKDGEVVKKIAAYAREDIEKIVGSKVFLTLFVRVEADWRERGGTVKNFGYDLKDI